MTFSILILGAIELPLLGSRRLRFALDIAALARPPDDPPSPKVRRRIGYSSAP